MKNNWEFVISSDLKAIKFENDVLSIMFLDGSIYEYYGIDKALFENLLNATSHGKFFHKHIKSFPFMRVK